MQWLRRRSRQSRVRAMISIGLLISVALLVLAIAGSHWVERVVTQYAVENYQANISGVMRMLDREIESFDKMATQLSGADWVRRIMLMQGSQLDKDRVPDYNLYEYQEQMKIFRLTNAMISEIGVMFFQKNLVISSYGKSDFRFLADNAVRVEGMAQEDWLNLPLSLTFSRPYQLDSVQISRYGVPSQSTLMIYPLQDGATSRISAAMFLVVHHSALKQFLSPQLLATGAQEARLSILPEGEDQPFLTVGALSAGDTQRLSAVSEKTGWQFTVDIPRSLVIESAINVRNILLAAVAAIWLVSMAASLLITRRFFFPIERIARMLQSEDEGARRFLNEYDAIRQGIAQMHDQQAELSAKLRQRQPMARAACLHALLTRADMDREERKRMLSMLDMRDDWGCYCACLLLPMLPGPAMPANLSALEGALAADDGAGQVIAGQHNAMPIVLLGQPNSEAIQARIVELLERFPDDCVIMGEVVFSEAEIAHSLRTALQARNFRLVSEGFRLQRYDESLTRKGGYYLPADIEYRLLQSIRNGSAPQAEEIFAQLYERNAAQSQATYASLTNFLFNIHLDLVKLIRESGLPESLQAQWPEDAHPGEIRPRVSACIAELSAHFRMRIQATPARMEDILDYVEANLYDANLSLTMVADAFGLSNSLISRLFSEQGSENFLNHVNRLRIEAACARMKRDPQMDILSVAQHVGYENDVTFRRLFKKYVGQTPSQYREQARISDAG